MMMMMMIDESIIASTNQSIAKSNKPHFGTSLLSSSAMKPKKKEKKKMADSSSSSSSRSNMSSNGTSSITSISQDHLLTILLLLPFQSILSFSMTCNKFRSIASSDSLWESLCRRDWGPTSVDALLNHRIQIPWMKLYKQLSQLDSVSCCKLSDSDSMAYPHPPSSRASHSLNFVSDCLVLFGGGHEGGRHLDDTWVAHIGNGCQRMLKWQKVNSGIPSGRFGHTCVEIGDVLVLFGGIDDHGSRLNDTWVGQLACHETHGITLSWKPLDVGTITPPHRGAHGACYMGNRKMVIHGGIGLNGIRLGDTWVLELSENFGFGTWCEIVTRPSPPARSGHTLTCIGEFRAVLFGGRGSEYEVLNDIWLLDYDDDCFKWIQILYELQNIPEGISLPRVGHSATRILGGRVLIYGGEDSSRHRKDDFWLLDLSVVPSIRMQPAKLNSKQLLAKLWKGLKVISYKPKCRSFHRACADNSGRYLYVFGGMVDGLLQPTEPAGLRFDGELFLVDLVHQV